VTRREHSPAGLLLTALGIGLALPSASIAITSGVQPRDQGRAGALFTSGQQVGAAVGLAILATAAATRTAHAASSLAGYRLSFLIAAGLAVLAAVIVAVQLRSRACQQELTRQNPDQGRVPPVPVPETQLRKC
jgi:MFS family permease